MNPGAASRGRLAVSPRKKTSGVRILANTIHRYPDPVRCAQHPEGLHRLRLPAHLPGKYNAAHRFALSGAGRRTGRRHFSVAFLLLLQGPHLRVTAARFEQCLMGALFDDVAVFHDQNLVGIHDGR